MMYVVHLILGRFLVVESLDTTLEYFLCWILSLFGMIDLDSRVGPGKMELPLSVQSMAFVYEIQKAHVRYFSFFWLNI